MSKAAKAVAGLVLGFVVAGGLGLAWLNHSVRPLDPGAPLYVRFNEPPTLDKALETLESKGVVRNAGIASLWLKLNRRSLQPRSGTFEVKPGMPLNQVVDALRSPIRRMVRIPEGWWISRAAKRLEREEVASAEEYIALAGQPEKFADMVDFPLPKDSLEGFLYPDTYDLPPLLGAERAIRMQLKAFNQKVGPLAKEPAKLRRAIIIASMIELEAALDRERPIIAGVIENRLRKGMRLELDATVLYAMGEWKNLGPGVVRTVKSPYNTYLNKGLPPGPIGSPSLKSIQAALKPAKHEWLFYVAKPDRSHLFAKTYEDHKKNIRTARALWRKERQGGNNQGR